MSNRKRKGTWGQWLFILLSSVAFGLLLFWLFGFLVADIGTLPGPQWSRIRAKYVDPNLVGKKQSLQRDLKHLKTNIINQKELQRIHNDSIANLETTINHLQMRLGSQENQQTITQAYETRLQHLREYQALADKIAQGTTRKHLLEEELSVITEKIKEQETEARTHHNKLLSRHRLKIAALKLIVMVPVFLVSFWFFLKKRSGIYAALAYPFFFAAFAKLALVIHEYFPRRYFKYIGLLVIIGIVLKLLIYMIKKITSPKKDSLIKQNRQAYDKFVCPVCGKPIRIGPLRYTRASKYKGLSLALAEKNADIQQTYTCPSCGTELYQKCDKCSRIRHSLLPFCEHCGSENPKWTQ